MNINDLKIEGLSAIEGPVVMSMRGHLDIPLEFDSERFAGAWVKDGPDIDKAKQDEILSQVRAKAQGWAIWYPAIEPLKSNATEEEAAEYKRWLRTIKSTPHSRVLSSGKYILMCRPLKLQRAVTAIYGRISQNAVDREAKGESVSVPGADSGILTQKQLNRAGVGETAEEIAV